MRHRKLLFRNLNKMKVFARTFAVFFLFLLIIFMMLGNKFESSLFSYVNGFSMKIVAPAVHVLGMPARGVASFYSWITDIYNVYDENRDLRAENMKLREENARYETLNSEYQLLSKLLHYTPPSEASFITVKIISNDSLSFSHSVIAYLGKGHNVKIGQIAVNDEGVVGRVEQVGGNYARIMLLNDINSRIPVITEKGRIRGILAGDNTAMMNLIFTPLDVELKIGDKIVTSGVSGDFPAGLPVGVVSDIQKGNIKVKTYADFNKIEYLRIIDYDASSE